MAYVLFPPDNVTYRLTVVHSTQSMTYMRHLSGRGTLPDGESRKRLWLGCERCEYLLPARKWLLILNCIHACVTHPLSHHAKIHSCLSNCSRYHQISFLKKKGKMIRYMYSLFSLQGLCVNARNTANILGSTPLTILPVRGRIDRKATKLK